MHERGPEARAAAGAEAEPEADTDMDELFQGDRSHNNEATSHRTSDIHSTHGAAVDRLALRKVAQELDTRWLGGVLKNYSRELGCAISDCAACRM